MVVNICGVCNQDPSKYKCPHCQLRYCSLKCFKTHIQEHDANEPPAPPEKTEAPSSAPAIQDEDEEPASHAPTDLFSTFRYHPQFLPLFMKYPQLRGQLKRVYAATQNPAISASQLLEEGGDTDPRQRRPHRDKVQGQWTQEKADKLAGDIMKRLREEEEGVREFMALVQVVFNQDANIVGRG